MTHHAEPPPIDKTTRATPKSFAEPRLRTAPTVQRLEKRARSILDCDITFREAIRWLLVMLVALSAIELTFVAFMMPAALLLGIGMISDSAAFILMGAFLAILAAIGLMVLVAYTTPKQDK